MAYVLTFAGYATCTISVLIFASILLFRSRRNAHPPYPPSPKGYPLIGNILNIPSQQEWVTYAKWCRELDSDLIHLNLAGNRLFVINSYEIAVELFEKRSAIYSDRPHFTLFQEVMGWDWAFKLFSYSPILRDCRKEFHKYLGSGEVSSYRQQMLKASRELLYRLANTPEDFMEHVGLHATSLILDVTYGISVKSYHHPYIKNLRQAVSEFAETGTALTYLVNTLPFLKYVPAWVPGSINKQAKEWRRHATDLVELPLQQARDEIKQGISPPSVLSHFYNDRESAPNEYEEKIMRLVSGAASIGGADTTVSVIETLFLAMTLYPEVLRTAQEEIDRVVGQDRLPDFSDKPNLPYVNALLEEVLRWKPVAPTGIPHSLMADDVYEGMFLPKNSTIFANSWAMLQDEKMYPNPTTFDPSRFLKDGSMNPDVRLSDAVFGFGRRICPGRFLVRESVFMAIVSVLATFDISKAIDQDGNPIIPSTVYDSGIVSRPRPFKCSIKPRSRQALDLVTEAHAGLGY